MIELKYLYKKALGFILSFLVIFLLIYMGFSYYLIICAIVLILFAVGFVIISWIVDPYRIFHKPWFRDDYYVRNLRIQASGIINTENFDSIILGTSMSANFSPEEASRVFGGKFVNISMDASSMAERSVVLQYALRKKIISKMIYSLEGFTKYSIGDTRIAPYTFLYDEYYLNGFRIYASDPKIILYALYENIILPSNKLRKRKTADLEHLTEWYSNEKQNKRFGGLHKWLVVKDSKQIKTDLESISNSIKTINISRVKDIDLKEVTNVTSKNKRVFQDHLMQHVSKHPEVMFYLYFPSYSRLYYAIRKQSNPQEFDIYLETIRFVVRECEKYGNVKVFGFETEQFLDDIANYKDLKHHHQKFDSEMLHWMKNDQHELTMSNLEEYIKRITILATQYPLKEIGKQMDTYLKFSEQDLS